MSYSAINSLLLIIQSLFVKSNSRLADSDHAATSNRVQFAISDLLNILMSLDDSLTFIERHTLLFAYEILTQTINRHYQIPILWSQLLNTTNSLQQTNEPLDLTIPKNQQRSHLDLQSVTSFCLPQNSFITTPSQMSPAFVTSINQAVDIYFSEQSQENSVDSSDISSETSIDSITSDMDMRSDQSTTVSSTASEQIVPNFY